jgi:simple sugar transport system substrate-binding protein
VSDDTQGGLEHGRGLDRVSLLKRLAAGGAALSLPSLLAAEAALGSPSAAAEAAANVWPKHPKWKFALINHVTTNPFFVPTQYGAADAAKMLDVSYTWGGSTKADVGEMINAFNAAISAKADGIAVCVVDKGAFEAPIRRALGRGIPVVAYNADGARAGKKARQAYIGQDLYVSGFEMGKRIVELVPSGDVALFIATPGALNIQPRIDGALAAIKQSGGKVKAKAVATSPDLATELSMIDAYYQGHKSLKGMFAVDAGDTQGVGQVIQKYKLQGKVKGGGYDLLPGTLRLIQNGSLQFTIDQQPYLQGFYPIVQLFLAKLSGGLVAPSDTNTGLLFVTKANVRPYLNTKTRYHGSSNKHKYPVSG